MRTSQIAVWAFGLVLITGIGRADIYQWEWMGSEPALGRRQSSVVCPDGTGVAPGPSVDLHDRNLAMAYLIGANLRDASLVDVRLPLADLTGANLSGAQLRGATLTGAELSGSVMRNANLSSAMAANANLLGANLQGAILREAMLVNANLACSDLRGADLSGAMLANANLLAAVVRGADLSDTTSLGFTSSQLYSTTTYQAHDLAGMDFSGNNLAGWNFAGQNLDGANFQRTNLTDTNFDGASTWAIDLRGATGGEVPDWQHSVILPSGEIFFMEVTNRRSFLVRDTTDQGRPVFVAMVMEVASGSTLRLLFEDANWASTIITENIPDAVLEGNLELSFADGVNPEALVGTTFDLFDWGDSRLIGQFKIVSDCTWDLSNLYSTGEVRLLSAAGLPGDANGDGKVDDGDAAVLAANWLSSEAAGRHDGDFNGDQMVDDRDAAILAAHWNVNRQARHVPEPSTGWILVSGCLLLLAGRVGRNAYRK